MTQKQISEFKENLLFIEESVKAELQGLSDSQSLIVTRSTQSELIPEILIEPSVERISLHADTTRINLDLEKIYSQVTVTNFIITKINRLNDKEKYYPIKFLYEQRRGLLTNIAGSLKTIKRLLNKLSYTSRFPTKRENLLGKRVKQEKVLRDYIREFNDWISNQRLLNGECLITQKLDLTFNTEI